MKVVIQRVAKAHVDVDGMIIGAINTGMLVLVGIHAHDTATDSAWMAKKICSLRIFNDNQGKMSKSLHDIGGEVLLVSQFTLCARTDKGNRPSFTEAMQPEKAYILFEQLVSDCEIYEIPVKTGRFGADMQVHLINDGPVTIVIDSKLSF